MTRYAAKLLFQFRIEVDGDPGKRRLCEERIVHLDAHSGRAAIAAANRRGRRAEYAYVNAAGNPVRFEFVGILDLLSLGIEVADGEVWYDIYERLTPMERRARLIPTTEALLARVG